MSSQLVWASRRIADLEAENARLQSALTEAKACANWSGDMLKKAERERDDYKALAELRGDALTPFALYHQARVQAAPRTAAKDSPIPVLSYGKVHLGDKHFREADAAIDATPEQAREKGQ